MKFRNLKSNRNIITNRKNSVPWLKREAYLDRLYKVEKLIIKQDIK